MLRRSDRDPRSQLETPALAACPLSSRRLAVLSVIATGPTTAPDIIDILAESPLKLSQMHANRLCLELEELGYIEIERGLRPVVWRITDQGRTMLRTIGGELVAVARR
jgi:DNA-binding MarR family transcriptional regulator